MAADSMQALVWAVLLLPFCGAALIPLFHRAPDRREAVTLVTAGLLAIAVWWLAGPVLDGARPEALGLRVAPGLLLAFKVEPLGLLFSLVASTLWIPTSIYAIGYMRSRDEPRQTSFYVCFALAIGAAMGIAFSANLFTLFLFYEALTLSTYPLVTHKATPEAKRAGRIYLLMLLGTSMLLLLPAILATSVLAGTLDFRPGGILDGRASPTVLALLLTLFVFGIGKAALMPMHFWLPAAMVAPTPVSALLHAVAVVKAGVFAIVKIVVYIFGLELITTSGAGRWLVYAAAATVLVGALLALAQTNLKARLAYSTVSQLAYAVLGAMLANAAGVTGAGLQLAVHAVAKITLFFCAGAIYVAAGKTQVDDLDGIGRSMPVTMLAFFVASLSIIGMPPLGGAWSKWYLLLGTMDADQLGIAAVLLLGSVLSVGYLMPIVARAFFRPPRGAPAGAPVAVREAPLACVVPLSATALLCLVLFFQVEPLERLVASALSGDPW